MKQEDGFTLVEVLIALGILTTVIMSLAAVTVGFVAVITVMERRAAAMQLVDSRLDEIRLDPDYGGLDTLYVGSETSFPTLAGYVRRTAILHVGGSGQANDYKRITVSVTGPGLSSPVSRTIAMAVP